MVSHAHDDRYYGAKALQDEYPKARLAMSAADWDVVAKDNAPAALKPRRDLVLTDGQVIKLGDVSVTTYVPLSLGVSEKVAPEPLVYG